MQYRIFAGLGSWALAVTVILCLPFSVNAQCGMCTYDGPTNSHTLWDFNPYYNDLECESTGGAECDGCHWQWESGTCGESHTVLCGSGGGEEEYEVDPESVIALAQTGNQDDVRELIRQEPSVEFNVDRKAIQVIDCRGLVAAHIPISEALSRLLSAEQGIPEKG